MAFPAIGYCIYNRARISAEVCPIEIQYIPIEEPVNIADKHVANEPEKG
jgi:hypothetical protein